MGFLAAFLAVLAAGSAVHQGEQSRAAGSQAERAQRKAQRQSLLSSINEEKLASQAERKANRKKPDSASILFSEREAADSGVGSTILSGQGSGSGSLLGSKQSLMG